MSWANDAPQPPEAGAGTLCRAWMKSCGRRSATKPGEICHGHSWTLIRRSAALQPRHKQRLSHTRIKLAHQLTWSAVFPKSNGSEPFASQLFEACLSRG